MNIAVLISGGGTTMEQVALACRSGRIQDSNVVLVIASNGSCRGLERARDLRIPTKVLRLRSEFNDNPISFGKAILHACQEVKADFIAQLGWLVRTPKNVIDTFPNRIINQHNAPLDPGRLGFGGQGMHGLTSHAAVLYFAQRVGRPFRTEAVVHRVTTQYDSGALLGIYPMEILPYDTPESLAARLLPTEHRLVLDIIDYFATGPVKEITRRIPVIRPGEESLYYEAIQYARNTTHQ